MVDGCGHSPDGIRCFYHDWRYALDGALRVVPQRKDQFPDLRLENWGLLPSAVGVWEGMVFAHPDPTASLDGRARRAAEVHRQPPTRSASARRVRRSRRALQLEAADREPHRRVPPLVPAPEEPRGARSPQVRAPSARQELGQLRTDALTRSHPLPPGAGHQANRAPRRARHPRRRRPPDLSQHPHGRERGVLHVLCGGPDRSDREHHRGEDASRTRGGRRSTARARRAASSTRTSTPANGSSRGWRRRRSKSGRWPRRTKLRSRRSTSTCSGCSDEPAGEVHRRVEPQ